MEANEVICERLRAVICIIDAGPLQMNNEDNKRCR